MYQKFVGKGAMISDSLVSEPQNKALLLGYEKAFAGILFSNTRYSDIFDRILYELTSRPSNQFTEKLVVFEVFDWKPFSALDHALKLD